MDRERAARGGRKDGGPLAMRRHAGEESPVGLGGALAQIAPGALLDGAILLFLQAEAVLTEAGRT